MQDSIRSASSPPTLRVVCVGAAPHHLMFDITALATQSVRAMENFLVVVVVPNNFVGH